MSVYDLLTPDGFSIHPEDTYSTMNDARKAFEEWKQQFEHQGYYSTVQNGRRIKIPLEELSEHMKLKLLKADYDNSKTKTTH